MDKLYNKLKKYSLKDAIKFENQDRQFLALKKLYDNKIMSDENYLFLIIVNSLICYQLSGKGEDYWEEFSEVLFDKKISNFEEINIFFSYFLIFSKNNKRFINIKLKRILKLEKFYKIFLKNYKYYYENMDKLVLDLSKTMNQKMNAKTITFAIKMFSYGARNIYFLKCFPENIMIPIDSRLENLYKKYENIENIETKQIKEFYIKLSKKLNIPLLHLDVILWTNYDKLIK